MKEEVGIYVNDFGTELAIKKFSQLSITSALTTKQLQSLRKQSLTTKFNDKSAANIVCKKED